MPVKCPSRIRCHHLLKTFYTGVSGWNDRQLPDGTVIWTAPTGHAYTTLPGSRIFFPTFDTTTAPLPPTTTAAEIGNRAMMMPRRHHTRTAQRAQRIREERALNAAEIAQWVAQAATVRNKPPPAPPPDTETGYPVGDDPPPF